MKYTLECCVDSVESAICAAENGATRLELCASLVIGGTTPSLAMLEEIRVHTDIRVHVLLRPRFGDFLYTRGEFNVLLREAELFKKAGVQGLVVGCLDADGGLDVSRMRQLLDVAEDIPITLHRAFDVCADPELALRQAQEMGIRTILTSGCRDCAIMGKNLLKTLALQAGDVEIMAGGGINAQIIQTLLQDTNLNSFHMSGKQILQSGMKYRNNAVNMGLPTMNALEIWRTNPQMVSQARDVLEKWELEDRKEGGGRETH